MVRIVLDIAVRSPWGRPQWNTGDSEGEDVRAASVGQLSVVYVANRLSRVLSVLGIVWLGQRHCGIASPGLCGGAAGTVRRGGVGVLSSCVQSRA
ncbi:hypothetical protein ACIGBL_34975, partial [Streptomyces sp. NPDC085614]|uniref:hypothetical protein n=1 Tax=Streptomyces sp. NPDC085614 TaxID=3365733 RepID=UPI0037D3C01E